MHSFSLTSTIRHYPTWPYKTMAADILGPTYTLSLAFVGETKARQLNIMYRKKDYVPNVLSFPLDSTTGEIYLCPAQAGREAQAFTLTPPQYIGYLFIHGLLHLKGYDHGSAMERLEKKFLHKYITKRRLV